MRVLVSTPINQKIKEDLFQTFSNIDFVFKDEKTLIKADIQEANIMWGKPQASLLEGDNGKLQWLQLYIVGSDKYTNIDKKLLLTTSKGAYGLAVSEHAIACMFTLCKKFNLYFENQKQGLWKDEGQVRSIWGSTVLILGAGNIGQEIAIRLKALGATKVIGIKRDISKTLKGFDELYKMDSLNSLLPESDFVIMCLPKSDDTYHIINKDNLKLMKKTSILINVGRGHSLDLEALSDALNEGQIYAASVDTTDPEPLPPTSKFYTAKNAFLTPHVAGFFHLEQTMYNAYEIFKKNLKNYLEGKELSNKVNM